MKLGFRKFRKPLTMMALGMVGGAFVAAAIRQFGGSLGGLGGLATYAPVLGAYVVGGGYGAVGYLIGSGMVSTLLPAGGTAARAPSF